MIILFSTQSELDTLSATLKQLENQRGEAQKRLDDLKAQVSVYRLKKDIQPTCFELYTCLTWFIIIIFLISFCLFF